MGTTLCVRRSSGAQRGSVALGSETGAAIEGSPEQTNGTDTGATWTSRHQSEGKIENANRVMNGVCRAMWLSLEDLLREKLTSDNMLGSVDTPHGVGLLEVTGKERRQNSVRTSLRAGVHKPISEKSTAQVHISASWQSPARHGARNLGVQGAHDGRAHLSHREGSLEGESGTLCKT